VVLDLALGRDKREELLQFLSLFQTVLARLGRNQEEMRRFFCSPEVSFLLVTSPTQAAVDEADHFARRAGALGLPIGGYVLNQSLAGVGDLARHEGPLSVDGALALRALQKLDVLAAQEERTALHHVAVAVSLRQHLGPQMPLWVLPRLTREDADLHALVRLADLLMAEPRPAEVALPAPPALGGEAGPTYGAPARPEVIR
jgi:hypothetical protein